jgi:uncharacterized coiled-coil protein SlyX
MDGMESPEAPDEQIKRLQQILAENHRITRETRDLLKELAKTEQSSADQNEKQASGETKPPPLET